MKTKFVILISLFVLSCKPKEDNVSPNITGTDVRDSVYYYSKIYYLWTDQLPAAGDFKPTGYGDPQAVINKVKTFSPKNTSFDASDPRSSPNADRFSFVTSQKSWYNQVAGSNTGFGFSRIYVSEADLRVRQIYEDSPFGKAGVKRGWRIVSVGNLAGNSANSQAISNLIAQNNTLNFTFEKPDGTQQTLSLTKTAYQANFIANKKVIEANGKKIGYFYFDSFLGNNSGQETIDKLTAIINDFASQKIDALVIDLRYNGGGYVRVQDALANLIAPTTAKSKRMYSYQYNEQLQAIYQQRNQVNINFNNSASALNITKVVFITSYYSASASELLINNLKPYMDVKLIGDKTYGKPVGFPVIDIQMSRTDSSQNIVVAPVAFKTVNSSGFGDYYFGIDVDKLQLDDATHDFGDPYESCFKDAIKYLTTGNFVRTSAETVKINQELRQLNLRTDWQEPIGMFLKK